jgi:hypothetical protein
MLWESRTETWDTKAFREAIFISMPAAAQWIHIQRLSTKNKGVSPYIPLQASYRSKKQGLTHIWSNLSTIYWGLLFPQCYVTFFTFRFFKFYLSAMPSLPPTTLSEHRLACFFFLALLPATLAHVGLEL